jgi:hypothetical protein
MIPCSLVSVRALVLKRPLASARPSTPSFATRVSLLLVLPLRLGRAHGRQRGGRAFTTGRCPSREPFHLLPSAAGQLLTRGSLLVELGSACCSVDPAPRQVRSGETQDREAVQVSVSSHSVARHLLGNKSIGRCATEEERRQDPCFGFELQDLSWEIQEDLDSLSSAQLAVSCSQLISL